MCMKPFAPRRHRKGFKLLRVYMFHSVMSAAAGPKCVCILFPFPPGFGEAVHLLNLRVQDTRLFHGIHGNYELFHCLFMLPDSCNWNNSWKTGASARNIYLRPLCWEIKFTVVGVSVLLHLFKDVILAFCIDGDHGITSYTFFNKREKLYLYGGHYLVKRDINVEGVKIRRSKILLEKLHSCKTNFTQLT